MLCMCQQVSIYGVGHNCIIKHAFDPDLQPWNPSPDSFILVQHGHRLSPRGRPVRFYTSCPVPAPAPTEALSPSPSARWEHPLTPSLAGSSRYCFSQLVLVWYSGTWWRNSYQGLPVSSLTYSPGISTCPRPFHSMSPVRSGANLMPNAFLLFWLPSPVCQDVVILVISYLCWV